MSTRQPSSSAFGRTVLCFPMTKFSFATVRPDMTTVPWTHIQSADIFVLLERVTNTADPNMQIRVVEGSNTLETIPLSHLCSNALRIKEAHEATSGLFNKIETLPIFGMTKEGAIAIRYNTPNAESRRTQMNFADDSNRRDLLSVLQDIGLVVTGGAQKSSAASIRPHHALPTTSSSSMQPPPPPSAPTLGRSQSTPDYHYRHDSPHFSLYPQQSEPRQPSVDTARLRTIPVKSNDIPSISLQSVQETSRLRHPDNAEPPTFLFQDHAETQTNHPSTGTDPVKPSPDPIPTLRDIMPPRRHLPFAKPPSRDDRGGLHSAASGTAKSSHATPLQPLPQPTFAGHDNSARAQYARSHTNLHPPKKDTTLGYPPMTSTQPPRESPSYTEMPPPPVYFQKPDSTGLTSASRRRVYNTVPDIEIHEDMAEDDTYRARDTEPSSLQPMRSSSPYDSILNSSPTRSRPVTSDSNDLPRLMSASRPSTNRSPNRVFGLDTDASLPNVQADFDRHLVNPQITLSSSSDKQRLAAYVVQPREQRIEALNSHIYNYLDDENFHTLCSDVEGAWRWRILGERVGTRE